MPRRLFLRRKDDHKLRGKTIKILQLLTQGLSADEVMAEDVTITPADIAGAAQEALQLNETAQSYSEFRQRVQKEYPRAYALWTQVEDRKILEMYEEGKTMREIGASVQRHQNAVRSRLRFLRVI
jgi:hypothetical protein